MEKTTGLYRPCFEHDSCGIGAVVDIQGRPSRSVVDDALKIVEKLEHRAGRDAAGETGDGVGILVQVSHSFFKPAAAACGITLGGPAGPRKCQHDPHLHAGELRGARPADRRPRTRRLISECN